MAEAINNADMVNTVSPTYAREILTKRLGKDLYPVLHKNRDHFTGIINGLDYKEFDPRTNKDVKVNYGISSLNLKKDNKLYLQKRFGFTQSVDIPLFCVITRLVGQKGLDLIRDVIPDLVALGGQIIILGSGWKNFEADFKNAQIKYPQSVAAEMYFDGNLAQTIYAGADIFLMPSGFEPCGLSQIIAMRFGTVPIVRKTGGLADTVKDGHTGFVFKTYSKNVFLRAIKAAIEVYRNNKKKWHQLQINGMKKDFSWKKSARKYMWLYRKAIRNHKKAIELEDKK
jgi:starch synthase